MASKEVVEDLNNVFSRFEFESRKGNNESIEEIGGIGFLGEFGYEFG